jgi:alginate O-acetyltransferase complex protein AlgI
MVFSSTEFLFVFLPLFLLAQCLLPHQNVAYVLFSLFFYFVGEGWYSAVVVASVVVNFGLGLAIEAQPDGRRRTYAVALGVSLNLASLFTFKYAAFFAQTALGAAPAWVPAHLPLGISFFTFHSVSYLVEVYRRDARAERSLIKLSLYMLMFPQLIAGPILRFHAIAGQLSRRVVTFRHVYFGLLLFCVGLAEKVLLADTIARPCDTLFARSTELSAAGAWLAVVSYAFQIFFDFSGYSHMAIGLGWLTGFTLPKNFDYPYVSQSITEFWRRWHISLSRWFRDYLYIPLGGNRLGPGRTYRNLLIVFLLCGLWHGAAWTFIAWGAYHGGWLVLERLGAERLLAKLPRILRHVYALTVVLVGWTLFRADNLAVAGSLLSRMFFLTPAPDMNLAAVITRGQVGALALAALLSVPAVPTYLGRWLQVATEAPLPKRIVPLGGLSAGVVAVVLLIAVTTKVLTSAYSPFIYFRF